MGPYERFSHCLFPPLSPQANGGNCPGTRSSMTGSPLLVFFMQRLSQSLSQPLMVSIDFLCYCFSKRFSPHSMTNRNPLKRRSGVVAPQPLLLFFSLPRALLFTFVVSMSLYWCWQCSLKLLF
ncbi:hypothetical protein LY78DRAFT_153208 [Colletotrichum sublineola]|nr:hypothetical protein LY78DRAFT_153208 [Colletotrichum sublineola]